MSSARNLSFPSWRNTPCSGSAGGPTDARPWSPEARGYRPPLIRGESNVSASSLVGALRVPETSSGRRYAVAPPAFRHIGYSSNQRRLSHITTIECNRPTRRNLAFPAWRSTPLSGSTECGSLTNLRGWGGRITNRRFAMGVGYPVRGRVPLKCAEVYSHESSVVGASWVSELS